MNTIIDTNQPFPVAQTSSLLYRRLPACRTVNQPTRTQLKISAAANWKSALQILSLLIILTACSLTSLAQTPIVISKSASQVIPVSITGFSGEADTVLKFDLSVLGIVASSETPQYTITGSSEGQVQGRLSLAGSSTPIFNRAYSGGSIHSQAHSLADDIAKEIRGTSPIFHTKIAFRQEVDGKNEICVSDFDGNNPVVVTHDGALVATPCWLPGGHGLLYSSWKGGHPQILEHDLSTGLRKVFAGYGGANLNPTVSPNGRHVAMILSKSGAPCVYICDADGGSLRQLITNRDEQSSLSWSPDSSQICYAYRSGRAALRKISIKGGAPESVRAAGGDIYGNLTDPNWSPDGKSIVFTCGSGSFSICVVPAEGGDAEKLVAGEDPCWAPNSRTVIFTRRVNGKRVLSLLDVPTKHVKDVRQISELFATCMGEVKNGFSLQPFNNNEKFEIS